MHYELLNRVTFQVTKYLSYFFKWVTQRYFVFPFILWHLSYPVLREIGSSLNAEAHPSAGGLLI